MQHNPISQMRYNPDTTASDLLDQILLEIARSPSFQAAEEHVRGAFHGLIRTCLSLLSCQSVPRLSVQHWQAIREMTQR